MALVTITNDPTSLVGSCIVFEAVAEDADVKEAVYRQVTEHCPGEMSSWLPPPRPLTRLF